MKASTFFEDLWRMPRGSSVLLPNSTGGHFKGVLDGRRVFPNAIVYAPRGSYSEISNALRLSYRGIDTAKPSGEMDYDDLEDRLDVWRPAIVCANMDAGDDVQKIRDIARRYNMENKTYVHADASVSGFVNPFVGTDIGALVNSIHATCGGRKSFVGAPFPCCVYANGILGTTDDEDSAYVEEHLGRIVLAKGYDGFERDAVRCLEATDDLIDELNLKKIRVAKFKDDTLRVFIKRPLSEEFCNLWDLDRGPSITVLPHTNVSEFANAVQVELNRIVHS